jgi:hypothetical protein
MANNFAIYGPENPQAVSNMPDAAKEHKVTIGFHDQDNNSVYNYVYGYMTNEFTYSSNGNYKNVWETNFPETVITRLISDETQKNLLNYGYATKKMFASGESPVINVDMICYSGDDDSGLAVGDSQGGVYNNPVYVAQLLANATLPKVASDNVMMFTNISNKLPTLTDVKSAIKNPLNLIDGGIQKLADITVDVLDNGAKNVLSDKFTSTKPPVCKLTIGNIFDKDFMVVKRVETTFSKEYLSEGIPLYAKFSISFESLFNSANMSGAADKDLIFGTGFKLSSGLSKSRVSFNSSSAKGPTP